MGFFKQVATALKPSSIARGLDAARKPPSAEEIEASLAYLSPEQRAAYDANMAEVQRGLAESQAAWGEARALSDEARILDGPAGRYLYGTGTADFGSPQDIDRQIAEKGAMGAVQEMRAKRKGEFRQGLRQSFGIHEIAQIEDPARRAQVAADERAAREAARQPYRAAHAAPIAISRLAARGETQLAEVMAYLASSGLAVRTDHLFGVYRVPDRVSGPLTPYSEQGRVVEWDVVHIPIAEGAPPPAPVAPLVATSFVGADQWVARSVGEPSVLDEDLALAFCLGAGIGPERCAGLARISEFRSLRGGGEGDDDLRTIVKGIVAIHPQEASGAFERMGAAAPLAIGDPAESGVHVEVLNWQEVGRAVHLKIHRPPPVPSPFPYLPATPQELLRAHLDVVGVHPADCYSAQATVDAPRALIQGGLMSTNLGPRQPCADGKPRMRTHGCEQVVVAYRDRPEYAEGRDRWAAYQRDVLHAHLERGRRLRAPIVINDPSEVPTRILRAALRASEALDRLETLGQEKLAPYRYCWPPVGQAS